MDSSTTTECLEWRRAAKMDDAARHTAAAATDESSIATLKLIFAKTRRVDSSDLKANDKVPNFDGHLVLHTHTDDPEAPGQPLGTLRVQIKTVKIDEDGASYSFKDTKFFNAISRTGDETPTLLIGVDPDKKQALWIHVTPAYVARLDGRTVHFPPNQEISEASSEFCDLWEALLTEHHEVLEKGRKAHVSFEVLKEIADPFPDLEQKALRDVQGFLQEYNQGLNGPFAAIRTALVGDAYQIGFAYGEFSANRMTYALFEIPYGKTDGPIKKLKTMNWREVLPYTRSLSTHNGNPLSENPQRFARLCLTERIKKTIENQVLHVDHSDVFAEDFVSTCVEHLYFCLGMEMGAPYDLKEIEKALQEYLPRWVANAVDYLVEHRINGIVSRERAYRRDIAGNLLYLDPESLYRQIVNDDSRDELAVKSRDDADAGTDVWPMALNHDKFPLRAAYSLVRMLRNQGREKVSPPFRARGLYTADHWSWTTDEWKEFGEDFFPNAWADYVLFVRRNFPDTEAEILAHSGLQGRVVLGIEPQDDGPLGKSLQLWWASLERADGAIDPLTIELNEAIALDEDLRGLGHGETFTNNGIEYSAPMMGWRRFGAADLNGPLLFDHHYAKLKGAFESWSKTYVEEA